MISLSRLPSSFTHTLWNKNGDVSPSTQANNWSAQQHPVSGLESIKKEGPTVDTMGLWLSSPHWDAHMVLHVQKVLRPKRAHEGTLWIYHLRVCPRVNPPWPCDVCVWLPCPPAQGEPTHVYWRGSEPGRRRRTCSPGLWASSFLYESI